MCHCLLEASVTLVRSELIRLLMSFADEFDGNDGRGGRTFGGGRSGYQSGAGNEEFMKLYNIVRHCLFRSPFSSSSPLVPLMVFVRRNFPRSFPSPSLLPLTFQIIKSIDTLQKRLKTIKGAAEKLGGASDSSRFRDQLYFSSLLFLDLA